MTQKVLLIIFSCLAIMPQVAKCQEAAEVDQDLKLEARDGETDITKTADYLNKKIKQLLDETTPSKSSAKNNLAVALSVARSELEKAFINETATQQSIRNAEQAVEKFKLFLQQYKTIEQMLEAALTDLSDYETDAKRSLVEKYKALMLLLKIQNSSTFEAAAKALKLYKDFKNGHPTPDTASNLPKLSDEHRKYFEEILRILKDHFVKDSTEVENILKQILMSPELLKQLYEALRDFSAEDEEGFLGDLWSLIF